MLDLDSILLGVQPETSRHQLAVPAAWSSIPFSEVVIDSRNAVPDALFVALAGERTDGHLYLSDAAQRGARGALVRHSCAGEPGIALPPQAHFIDTMRGTLDTPPTGSGDDPFLLIGVDEPLHALQRLAQYHRGNLTPTVVGITGSVGKTSTKEMVAAVLGRRFCTLKTRKSYNSEASLPTVLLQLTPDHTAAVLELGMWAPGEIRHLASLARPHIGIVTNIGPSHLERMGSMEAITNAKAELVEALPPEGVALLNRDDERVRSLAARTQARVVTYGTHPEADLCAEQVTSNGLQGIACTLRYQGERRPCRLPLVGRHTIYNALAAAASGLVLGLSWDDILAGLHDTTTQLRINVIETHDGITILDDTYNAAPASVIAALDLLAELHGYRLAILGDMLELGSVEEDAHRRVGTHAAAIADSLICLGSRAHRWVADAAAQAGMNQELIYCVDTHDHAVTLAQHVLQSGHAINTNEPNHRSAYILVKGSRGLAMEHIVHRLASR